MWNQRTSNRLKRSASMLLVFLAGFLVAVLFKSHWERKDLLELYLTAPNTLRECHYKYEIYWPSFWPPDGLGGVGEGQDTIACGKKSRILAELGQEITVICECDPKGTGTDTP